MKVRSVSRGKEEEDVPYSKGRRIQMISATLPKPFARATRSSGRLTSSTVRTLVSKYCWTLSFPPVLVGSPTTASPAPVPVSHSLDVFNDSAPTVI